MFPSPVPGEALLVPRRLSYGGTVVNNITLATMTNEIYVDALIDTGASLCIVPPNVSRALGFESRNRLRQRRVLVVGGEAKIDVHRLEYMKVGSARAHNVLLACTALSPNSESRSSV